MDVNAVREPDSIHIYCEALNDGRGCGRECAVDFGDAPVADRVRAAAERLFAKSCGVCRSRNGYCYPLFMTMAQTSPNYMDAIVIVKATFCLMRITPVETGKER